MQDQRDDNREAPGAGEPGPDPGDPSGGPPGFPPGIFDRINNYLLLVYAFACLLMNYSLAGLFYFNKMIFLTLALPGIFSILIPFYFLSRRSMLGFAREFSFTRPDLKTSGLVVAVAIAAILPVEAFSSVFERMWGPDADYTSFILSIKPKGPASFLLVAIGIVLVAAVTEELLFRGFIQRIFQRNMSGPLAVVLAGLLFSLAHFNPPLIPGTAALGILFGYLFYRTGSLWYPIAGHAIYNLVMLVRLNEATEEEIVAMKAVPPDTRWTLLSLAVLVPALWLLHRLHRRAGQ
jgi:membrane protease YdiL (CAAX protease family)